MKIDSHHFNIIIGAVSENGQLTDGRKTKIEKNRSNQSEYKSHYGVVGKAADANSNRSKHRGQQHQSEIGASCSTGINSCSGCEVVDGKIINQCRNKRNQCHDETSQKFSTHDLPATQGTRL